MQPSICFYKSIPPTDAFRGVVMVAKRSSRALACCWCCPRRRSPSVSGTSVSFRRSISRSMRRSSWSTLRRRRCRTCRRRSPRAIRSPARPRLAAVPERRAGEDRAHRRRPGSHQAARRISRSPSRSHAAGRGQLGSRPSDPRVHRAARSAGVHAQSVAGRQRSRSRRLPPARRSARGDDRALRRRRRAEPGSGPGCRCRADSRHLRVRGQLRRDCRCRFAADGRRDRIRSSCAAARRSRGIASQLSGAGVELRPHTLLDGGHLPGQSARLRAAT